MNLFKQNSKLDNKGIVSIVVTLLLILILTIVIISFSSFTRREQVETFERQLGTEAFYAAESGINDALEELKQTRAATGANSGLFVTEKTNCTTLPPSVASHGNIDNEISPDGQAAYTCLLIDPTPKSVEATNISEGDSEIFPMQRVPNGAGTISNLGEIDIYWHSSEAIDADFSSNFSGCNTLAVSSMPATWPANCPAGMLRVEIVRVPTTSSFNEAYLFTNAMTFFVKPRNSGTGSITYNPVNNGQIAQGDCNNSATSDTRPKHCRLRITGLNGADDKRFYVRLTALYMPAEISMCSPTCGNATGQELAGSQAVIDSTGRASDILRRVQVRVDISQLNGPFPQFAIESRRDICKRFSISPDNAHDPADSDDFIQDTPNCSFP